MSGAENDTEVLDPVENGDVTQDDPDALFGTYSVLSPGVQIVQEGRPDSASPGE